MITRTVAIPNASLVIKRPIWPSRQRPSPEHDVAGGPKISDADLRNMLSQNFYEFLNEVSRSGLHKNFYALFQDVPCALC